MRARRGSGSSFIGCSDAKKANKKPCDVVYVVSASLDTGPDKQDMVRLKRAWPYQWPSPLVYDYP